MAKYRYYISYMIDGQKRQRTELFDTFEEAFCKYLDLLEQERHSKWAWTAYHETKIVEYCH